MFNGRFSDYQKRSNKLKLTLKISNWRTRSLNFHCLYLHQKSNQKKNMKDNIKKRILYKTRLLIIDCTHFFFCNLFNQFRTHDIYSFSTQRGLRVIEWNISVIWSLFFIMLHKPSIMIMLHITNFVTSI